jgi:hypothetical protein
MGSLGLHFTADELSDMVAAADGDGDNQIGFEGMHCPTSLQFHLIHAISAYAFKKISCARSRTRAELFLFGSERIARWRWMVSLVYSAVHLQFSLAIFYYQEYFVQRHVFLLLSAL